MTPIQGLSESEVVARRQRGEGNDVKFETSRSYADIVRSNALTFFNVVLFTIGAILVLVGRPNDAITSVGIITLNTIISIYQEIRAKRKLDEIALLTRPQVTVMREGQETTIDPAELVRGDILVVRPGDQIVVDGEILGEGRIEVDESLLTGESDLVLKQAGDAVLSGSFCVTGSAKFEAQKVGAESFANKLTAGARAFRVSLTPLQIETNFLVRVLMLVALFFGFLLFVSSLIYETPLVRNAQIAAVIIGLVPNGLFLMIAVAYAMGGVRMAGQGALIQQSNAVESLSHLDVLCTDKTGTLTANRIRYHNVCPIGVSESALKRKLADFASSASVTNRTSQAIIEGLGGKRRQVVDEVTFSSDRKWSGLAFDDHDLRGVYVLGAIEMLQSHLPSNTDLSNQVRAWADEGLRVLLFAHNPDVTRLHDAHDEPSLPPLTPLGLLSFSDELRPQVQETIAGFTQAGVRLKVISGDSPDTVVALAKQAGLPRDIRGISGPELERMGEAQFAQVADEVTVFGRITPVQKEKLVDALRQRKQHVAMIGDGVNDVLSLKKADVGIAMQSGSDATRGVADIILLNDSFAALLPAFLEGQRIVNGMGDILRLFLSRSFGLALMIAAVAIVGVGFPSVPTHGTLYAFLTVAIPVFFLALWARPARPKQSFIQDVIPFVAPAALSVMAFGLIVYAMVYFGVMRDLLPVPVTQAQLNSFETYAGYPLTSGDALKEEAAGLVARTFLTTFSVLAGIVLVLFVAPPIRFLAGIKPLSDDKRPVILAVGTLLLFIFILAVEPVRSFFELILLRPLDYLAIIGAVVLWTFVLRYTWRAHVFERFLGLQIED